MQSPSLAPLGLVLLKMTSEELVCPREDLSVARKEELKKLLLDQIPTVLNLLTGETLRTRWFRVYAVVNSPLALENVYVIWLGLHLKNYSFPQVFWREYGTNTELQSPLPLHPPRLETQVSFCFDLLTLVCLERRGLHQWYQQVLIWDI